MQYTWQLALVLVPVYYIKHLVSILYMQTYMDHLWKVNLDLRVRDKVVLRKGILCDRHMYAANQLLAVQFPGAQGLQSTLLSQTSFTSIQLSGGIIHDG